MQKITVLLLIFIHLGCQSKKNDLDSYFDKDRQVAIQELIKLFKNEICITNFDEEIFRVEIEKIKTSVINGNGNYSGLDYQNISEITDRLNSIYDLGIFTKECTLEKKNGTSIKYYCLSPKSNFRKYLNENKNMKKSWRHLDDELSAVGVLSSNSIRYLLSDKDEIDINSDGEILVLAVTLFQNVFRREAEKQSKM